METTATILHADLDAFYASVEQLLDPSLRGKPIAVGGGVVLAASYEAKAFGVRGGMPGRRARELCPQLHLRRRPLQGVPAARRRGDRRARRLHAAGRAHLHRRGLRRRRRLHASVRPAGRDRARRSGARVRAELGLPISVGVARTKHLAKIASQVAKPDGLVVVDPATELAFLHDLPVELMWGVGPVTKARLAEIGIATIGQLADDAGRLARAAARPGGGREARRAGLEPRSRARSRRIGARTRPARSRRSAGSPPSERVFRPTLRHLADRVARRLRAKSLLRPDRDGARALRRPPRGDALGDARRADLGDRDPRRGRRGTGARRARATTREEKTISLLAISVSHLEEHARAAARAAARPRRREAPARRQARARRASSPTAPSTRSATASAGRRSATPRSRLDSPRSVPDAFPRAGREGAVTLPPPRVRRRGSVASGPTGRIRRPQSVMTILVLLLP